MMINPKLTKEASKNKDFSGDVVDYKKQP